jgi:hypothetical protein
VPPLKVSTSNQNPFAGIRDSPKIRFHAALQHQVQIEPSSQPRPQGFFLFWRFRMSLTPEQVLAAQKANL